MQPQTPKTPIKYQTQPNIQPQNKFKIAILTITIFLIGVLIIGILGALGIFHRNTYGPEIKITNFSKYYRQTPANIRDSIFSLLYSTASSNTNNPQVLESATASIIENQPITNDYDDDTNVHTSSFSVDVPAIQQSFHIQFGWSDEENNPNINTGNNVTITCLRGDKSSYHNNNCVDAFTSLNIQKLFIDNPILNQLPIKVSRYSDNYSTYINYTIDYKINDEETDFTITITDYTGGNRENALNEIRKRGYNPSDYTIEYKDESADQAPGRVPESDIMTDI